MVIVFCQVFGTTSACAENTQTTSSPHCGPWNYLRVRGEYPLLHTASARGSELPPRARRIPVQSAAQRGGNGTTSACAENTIDLLGGEFFTRNYLRVRGEYLTMSSAQFSTSELPPRARRILPYARWR